MEYKIFLVTKGDKKLRWHTIQTWEKQTSQLISGYWFYLQNHKRYVTTHENESIQHQR